MSDFEEFLKKHGAELIGQTSKDGEEVMGVHISGAAQLTSLLKGLRGSLEKEAERNEKEYKRLMAKGEELTANIEPGSMMELDENDLHYIISESEKEFMLSVYTNDDADLLYLLSEQGKVERAALDLYLQKIAKEHRVDPVELFEDIKPSLRAELELNGFYEKLGQYDDENKASVNLALGTFKTRKDGQEEYQFSEEELRVLKRATFLLANLQLADKCLESSKLTLLEKKAVDDVSGEIKGMLMATGEVMARHLQKASDELRNLNPELTEQRVIETFTNELDFRQSITNEEVLGEAKKKGII